MTSIVVAVRLLRLRLQNFLLSSCTHVLKGRRRREGGGEGGEGALTPVSNANPLSDVRRQNPSRYLDPLF
jgi:hypothetical protein